MMVRDYFGLQHCYVQEMFQLMVQQVMSMLPITCLNQIIPVLHLALLERYYLFIAYCSSITVMFIFNVTCL